MKEPEKKSNEEIAYYIVDRGDTKEIQLKIESELDRRDTLLAHYQEALRVKDEALKKIETNFETDAMQPFRQWARCQEIAREALSHQPPSDRKEAV